MLQRGEALIDDLAWLPGMAEWLPLHSVLYPASTAPAHSTSSESPSRLLAEPATAKQKAFLSYLGISLDPKSTKEEAALLVNDAMENPREPARLARWNEDRLRLHPDLYATEIQTRKEQRATRFFEVCKTQGAECLDGVTKAHCQVLVGYLDVKHPSWDANETEAAWNYFFPAVREKFPQLVRPEWRDKLKFPQGPRVVAKTVRRPGGIAPRKRASPLSLLARGVAIGLILIGVTVGALYLRRHPEQLAALIQQGKTLTAMLSKSAVAGSETSPPSGGSTLPGSSAVGQPPSPPAGADLMAGSPVEIVSTSPPSANADANLASATSTNTGAPASSPPTKVPGVEPGAASVESTAGLIPGPKTHVTLIEPVKIQTPYGPMEFRKGMTFPLVSQEGVDVTVRFQGRIIDIPASSTDLAGESPTR